MHRPLLQKLRSLCLQIDRILSRTGCELGDGLPASDRRIKTHEGVKDVPGDGSLFIVECQCMLARCFEARIDLPSATCRS